MSRKLRPSMGGDSKPYTEYGRKGYIQGIDVPLPKILARVKGVIIREGEQVVLTVSSARNHMFVFTFETSRAWMNTLVKMQKRDRRRKHKWVSDRPITIGEWLWKELNSPWNFVKIKLRAPVDDTLPPEGAMDEKELRIIYGKTV